MLKHGDIVLRDQYGLSLPVGGCIISAVSGLAGSHANGLK